MKKTLLIILFALPFISCSQTNYNELTKSAYNNIAFNNITLSELSNFQGNINDLSQLFGIQFTNTSNDPDGEAKDYESSDIIISYFGYEPNQELSGIAILTSNTTITINSTSVKIGDNIALLGYGNQGFKYFLTNNNSSEQIAIFKPVHEDSYIVFYFLQSNGEIIDIKYVSPS